MSTSSEALPSNVRFLPEAEADLLALDRSQQIKVLKAIVKIAQEPGRFGKPLGNGVGSPLAGLRSAYVNRKTLRIIWTVTETGRMEIMLVAGIGRREGMFAYRLVGNRLANIDEYLDELGGREKTSSD